MTATEQALTPRDAAAEILRIQNLDAALERRSSGITWMVWGIAAPGIFMTYNFLGSLTASVSADTMVGWFAIAWLPWVVMGIGATMTVWRSAGIVAPRLGDVREGLKATAYFAAFFGLGVLFLNLVEVPIVEPAVMLGIVGVSSLALAVSGLLCAGGTERWLLGIGGALALVCTIVGVLATSGDESAAYSLFAVLGPLVTAIAWFGTGLYVAVRG